MSDATLFIKQCEALVLTLTEAKEIEDARLDMGNWVDSFKDPTVKHFCNTVACVCGYQAISNRLEHFKQGNAGMYTEQIAMRISNDLTGACPEGGKLARSIFFADRDERLWAATDSGLFGECDLQDSNHLNEHEPSFDDAIEHIKVVITKVKEEYL
ncbi:hypothetical protein BAE46_00915 [Glaciecola punicea]|uniref:hypothetical protein n=1 Tax=Glaciecola punicea TaxID=56804 RepID=UPI0008731A74|nr:hypothetical protein [Glaciecola punicea]OFA33303.1 hypothetical protein BAE46_00915 [Glaciecola punicea]